MVVWGLAWASTPVFLIRREMASVTPPIYTLGLEIPACNVQWWWTIPDETRKQNNLGATTNNYMNVPKNVQLVIVMIRMNM